MTFTFAGFHKRLDGYGEGTINIARELKAIEPTVKIVDMQDATDADWQDDCVVWTSDRSTVALCTPDWLPKMRAPKVITYTMFEADKLPAGWVEKINTHADQCLVPCRWCAEIFKANGVTIPISVVKWGIQRADYFPLKRERDGQRPYTFLWSGTPDQRKGWDVAYQAFCQAFGHDRDVQLILHFRDPMPMTLKFSDPNVRAVIGLFDRAVLREMYREVDCFVFPSRGEGWGSPPREAAATGLPVIVTNYGGLAEDLTHWGIGVDLVGKSPARYGWWAAEGSDIGQWVEPSIDQVAARMTWCYLNPAQANDFGERAANWLRTNATWERTARGIMEAIC